MIKISTWNVNSIRSRLNSLDYFIKNSNPDIILLQELKCTDEQFPQLELSQYNYNIILKGQKAYNGVAILSKYPLYDVKYDLPLYNLVDKDEDSRYLEARVDINGKTLKIASIYVPNGGTTEDVKDITETEKFYNKIKFYRRLKEHFELDIKNKEMVIYGGDFNTCPQLIDMYSIKKDGDICCNIKERVEFEKILNIGLYDLFRKFYKENKEYSWWGYRAKSWEKNLGLRIDALLTSDDLINNITDCFVEKNIRELEKPSDHVPMTCLINL